MSGNQSELLNLRKSAESTNNPAVDAKAAAAAAKGTKTDGSAQAAESDGLLEVEKASLLRFTEDDRVHEVSLFSIFLVTITRMSADIS